MDAVVVEAEADHQRVHAQHALEITRDRNRAAATDQCRGGVLYELVWDTTQTTQVYYGLEGAPAAIGKSVGKASICHLSTGGNYTPPRFVLVAEGPGGKVQQIVTGGYRIP